MAAVNREPAFLTPSLVVFYMYMFILTIVMAFLAPLFITREEYTVNTDNKTTEVSKTIKGYLTKIEEHDCLVRATGEQCTSDQRNATTFEYPSTIVIVQISVCCPFVLVAVICCYWELRRHRRVPTKTVTIVVICVKFEILHTLGFIFYPIFIGPEVGFTWEDLDMGFYTGVVNIAMVWLWLLVKVYTSKRARFKRKYKGRRRRSDPVFVENRFIFVDQSKIKRSQTLFTTTGGKRDDTDTERGDAQSSHNLGEENKLASINTSSTLEGVVNFGFSVEQGQSRPSLQHAIKDEISEYEQHYATEENVSTQTTEDSDTMVLNVEEENNETIFIKSLIEKLWSPELVGIGRDANIPEYTKINVRNVQRVQNETVRKLYMTRKKDIWNSIADNLSGKLFSPEDFGTDIKPVKTDQALELVTENNFENKTDKNVNEHYLFHGTEASNIPSITQNGFDKSTCQRTMLGKGIYFTDHPVKADQYTGARGLRGEQTTCCMILARVLLGNMVITKVRNSDLTAATSTPCKVCLSIKCSHDSSCKFDSLIFDGGLFREYVVYDNCLAYPEYVIYYERVQNQRTNSTAGN